MINRISGLRIVLSMIFMTALVRDAGAYSRGDCFPEYMIVQALAALGFCILARGDRPGPGA